MTVSWSHIILVISKGRFHSLYVRVMKLVMTLLVRDEEDILAANLDFHLKHGVDFFIATDNLSIDHTPEILRSYEQRGLLHYMHEPADDYSQHRWVARMARLACTEYAADWVINSDADEFWWPLHGDLKQVLGAMPPPCCGALVERMNFVPRPRSVDDFFADVMTLRERQSFNALGQPLPGKVCHRAFPDIEIDQGNHGIHRHGQALAVMPTDIVILHFPVRSYLQFANKISKGGAAYERNTDLPHGLGATWRHLYKIWQRGEFEDYYRRLIVDATEAADDGRLLFDDRLKLFFLRLRSRPAGMISHDGL